MAKAKRKSDSEDTGAPAKPRGAKPARKGGGMAVGVIVALLSGAVWAGLLGAGALAYFAMDLPAVDEAALTRRPHVQVLDADGKQIANFGDIYGELLDLKKVPAYL